MSTKFCQGWAVIDVTYWLILQDQGKSGNMSRVLGRIRLSRNTDESTSVERQREIIQRWSDDNGHTVVAWAEDVDVSGAISPFDAPALAPYLGERAGEWDILVAWKLDRLARRSIPLHKLFGWVQDNGKTLVCVADNIDLSNWVGRLVASVIAGVAEGELEAIRERTSASYKKLVESGRWPGGRHPYGYRPVKLPSGGYRLEQDPEAVKVIRWIIDEYTGGKSLTSVVRELTEQGVPTPAEHMWGAKNREWTQEATRGILQSKNLLGWAMLKGEPILDEQGRPVIKAPPILTMEEYQRVQQALASGASHKSTPDRTSPLLEVLKCWECGGNMHAERHRNRKTKEFSKANYSYFCPKHKSSRVNGPLTEELVEKAFLLDLAHAQVSEKRIIPANDLSEEINEAQQSYDSLVEYIPNARTPESRSKLYRQLELLEQRILSLGSQSTGTDTVEWIDKDQTYQELWDSLDDQERRLLMVRSGFVARARTLEKGTRWKKPVIELEVQIPLDLRERLGMRPQRLLADVHNSPIKVHFKTQEEYE